MKEVTSSQFRQEQSRLFEEAQREPIAIMSRGSRMRAVVVSPDFFQRAMEALEDQADIQDAEAARNKPGEISHEELKKELGLN
ncbi:type II toxin-antitoxin system Phd/YefM family antitoxin [Corynebacterium sp. H128]|uniref:type II toxin-antitoxin system Phd/YefM family antitoxin n=1 Tax=unclassified Corynebacterium TaxID=2624378 RepID=UPI0030B128D8